MTKLEILKQYFGHEKFRSGQEDIIDNILSGKGRRCRNNADRSGKIGLLSGSGYVDGRNNYCYFSAYIPYERPGKVSYGIGYTFCIY